MRTLLMLLVTATLSLSCGDEETGGSASFGPPPVFGAVDPSMSCQPGYVGWDFATGGGIEALPKPMKIVSLSCDGGGDPATPSVGGQGVRAQCANATSCNFVEHCESLAVKWTCGDQSTEYQREFPGGRGSLSCYVPGNQEAGASDLSSRTGKACVPKSCPDNTFRDEKLRCVTAFKRKPGFFAFGPPTAIPLQRTSANQSSELLVGDTEYFFVSSITLGTRYEHEWNQRVAGMPEGRLEYWFADEYVAKDPSSGLSPVQGFRCTAAQAYVSAHSLFSGVLPTLSVPPVGQRWVVSRTIISPQCTADAAAAGAERDAARRATMSLADFRAKYRLSQLRLHSSFDLEGQNILPEKLENVALPESARTCLPRPPGFFYRVAAKPEDSYIDMIAYYQQRELTAYLVNDSSNYATTDRPHSSFHDLIGTTGYLYSGAGRANGTGRAFGARSSEFPTRIRISAKTLKVNTPEIEIAKFGDVQPRIAVSVEHRIAGGDNRSNPYGFDGPTVAGAKSLKARRLSADVYMHPATSAAFDASTAVKIASVPLGDALPTGSMTNGTASIGKRNRRRFFEEWKGIDTFKLFYCIGAEGLSTLSPLSLDLPVVSNAGVDYGAGVDPDSGYDGVITVHRCVAADTVMVVHRDESRRPLDPAAVSANQESDSEAQTGDSNSQGAQGTQGEKSCTGSRCTTVQHADMGILGTFGSTVFDSSSTTVEEQEDDGSGQVDMDADAEVLGFTVLDMPGDGTGEWGDGVDTPATNLAFSLSPEWGAIEEAIDKALNGTSVEAEEGRYAGRDGLGIAFGYKTYLTGPVPGVVNVGVSAGLGLSVDVEVTNKPDNDYPCEASPGSSEKCYLALEEASTQEDARAECAKLGGYLAEIRTEDELDDIATLLAAESGRMWLGAQQAYEYVGGSCVETPDATCVANAKLSYRWLSNDESFATATGAGAVVINAVSPLTSGDVSLVSALPTETAVAYDTGSDRLVLRATNELLRGVCEFDPARDSRYLRISGGLSLGVGAGLGMSFCTPSDEFGVCLEGSINFVALGIQFVAAQETHTIVRAVDGKINRIGGSGTDVPWSLSILSGSIVAKFNFYLFSISATILNWDGFTVAQGSLFDTYTAVVEKAP